MRILVTGVGGFVGTALARRLAEQGERVFASYLGEDPLVEGIEALAVDVLDLPAVAAMVDRASPDMVVHLAGLSHVGESWKRPDDYFRVNVLGAENVLRATEGCRFLLASSAEVYGRVEESGQPIAETEPLAPRNPYAMTKAAAERLVLARGGVVVRMFNVVGPGQAPGFALPSFARRLAAIQRGGGGRLRVGNLSARRDFLHVEDAVEAYETLIRRAERGGIYNVGSGTAVSIGRALEMLIEIAGVEVEQETDPELFRPADVELTCADNRRLHGLGWAPRKDLRQALIDLWREIGETEAA